MPELTIDQFIKKLTNFEKELEKSNRPLQIAVMDAFPRMAKRIFQDGQKSDGTQIGQYDTKRELYINPDTAPAAGKGRGKFPTEGLKPTTGKTGKHIFASTGEPHKTTWVANYKDFRNRIGRRIDRVNLNLSNDLESDFKSQNPLKINANEYQVKLKREINVDKVEGNEERFGRTFAMTQKEKDKLVKVYQTEILLAFNGK